MSDNKVNELKTRLIDRLLNELNSPEVPTEIYKVCREVIRDLKAEADALPLVERLESAPFKLPSQTG